jgi:hypothetical protein
MPFGAEIIKDSLDFDLIRDLEVFSSRAVQQSVSLLWGTRLKASPAHKQSSHGWDATVQFVATMTSSDHLRFLRRSPNTVSLPWLPSTHKVLTHVPLACIACMHARIEWRCSHAPAAPLSHPRRDPWWPSPPAFEISKKLSSRRLFQNTGLNIISMAPFSACAYVHSWTRQPLVLLQSAHHFDSLVGFSTNLS